MKEKKIEKIEKKEESKQIEISSNFQRQTTIATLVPVIPKFKGICPNC